MSSKAFVTGGTGFIGLNLIELLTRNGWEVCALHRATSDLSHIRRFPVQLREGSVTSFDSLLGAIPDGTQVVFHLAGDTNLWSKFNQRQKAVNVDGTCNTVRAAGEKGVQTFIHTSSTSAWGSMSGKTVTEQLEQLGHQSWVNYERTKWAGEREVLNNGYNEMKVVILNPSTVTGPYDLNNWGRLFFALPNGDLPGIPNGVVSVTHVREVVKAHLAAVTHGRNRNRYILSGKDCRFSDFVREIAHISGVEKLPRKIPTPLLKILARIAVFNSALTGRQPKITPELVKLMTRTSLSYSSRKAIDELGYRVVPMKRSVRDCYRWLRDKGYLQDDQGR